MNHHLIINIGRQFGSGGLIVSKLLAQQLNMAIYDKELLQLAAKESGLCKEIFENVDEKKGFGWTFSWLGIRNNIFSDEPMQNYLSNESLFLFQSEIIRQLANKQSSIFIGRCADYILRDYPNCINIFLTAHLEDRIQRISEQHPEYSADKLIEYIDKSDKRRASYYNYYTNKKWGDAKSYHLCINTSVLGIDGTINYIVEFIKLRKKIN
jgi:cytidylate kinase